MGGICPRYLCPCAYNDVEFDDEVEVVAYKQRLPAGEINAHGYQFEQNLGSRIRLPETQTSLYSGSLSTNLALSPANTPNPYAAAYGYGGQQGYQQLPPTMPLSTASMPTMELLPEMAQPGMTGPLAQPGMTGPLKMARPGMTGPLRGLNMPPVSHTMFDTA